MLIRSRPCFSCRSPFLPTVGPCHAGMLILSADHRNHRLHYHISLFVIIIICISLFIIIITIIIIIHAHYVCLSRRNADLVCVQPIIIIHSIFIQLIFQPIEITMIFQSDFCGFVCNCFWQKQNVERKQHMLRKGN